MLKFLRVPIFLAIPLLASAHYHTGYFHSASDPFETLDNWMSRIGNDKQLHQLSIPGTHDSGSHRFVVQGYDPSTRGFVETQALNFNEQLRYGLRVFDIRVQNKNAIFQIVHGDYPTDEEIGVFFSEANRFLDDHPSEFILFRLKIDKAKEGNDEDEDVLRRYKDSVGQKFLKINDFRVTVEEIRGKMIIISDNFNFDEFGYRYADCATQDYYDLNDNWALYYKWLNIKNHLHDSSHSNGNCKINYLSANNPPWVQPSFVASGHVDWQTSSSRLSTGLTTPGWSHMYPDFPRTNCFGIICTISFEGTNVLTTDLINSGGDN